MDYEDEFAILLARADKIYIDTNYEDFPILETNICDVNNPEAYYFEVSYLNQNSSFYLEKKD